MGIGNGESGFCIAGDFRGIAINSVFCDGVLDLLAVLVFFQSGEFPCALGNSNRIDLLTIGQQVDGDGLRTDAILIVGIFPHLGTADSQVGKAVGQGACSGICRATVVSTMCKPGPLAGLTELNFRFGNGHAKFRLIANTADEGIIGNVTAESGSCCNRFHNQCTFKGCQCIPGPAHIVVALLGNNNGLGILCAADGQGTAGLGFSPAGPGAGIIEYDNRILCVRQNIIEDSILFNGEFHAHRAFAGAGNAIGNVEAPGPVGAGNGLGSHLLTVSQQVDGDGIRTTGFITIVIPDLLAGDGHASVHLIEGIIVHILVGDGISGNAVLIAFGSTRLTNGIVDLRTCAVLGQAGPGMGPSAGFIQFNRLADSRTVAIQLEADACRTLAQAVIIIFPDLICGDIHGLRGVAVGDSQMCAIVANRLGIDVGNIFLIDGIGDAVAGIIMRGLTGKGMLPAVVIAEDHRIVQDTVGIQVDGNACGADAITVIVILPDLHNRDHIVIVLHQSDVVGTLSGIEVDAVILAVSVAIAVLNGVLDTGTVVGDTDIIIGISVGVHQIHHQNGCGAFGQSAQIDCDIALPPFSAVHLIEIAVGNTVDGHILHLGQVCSDFAGTGADGDTGNHIDNLLGQGQGNILNTDIQMIEGMIQDLHFIFLERGNLLPQGSVLLLGKLGQQFILLLSHIVHIIAQGLIGLKSHECIKEFLNRIGFFCLCLFSCLFYSVFLCGLLSSSFHDGFFSRRFLSRSFVSGLLSGSFVGGLLGRSFVGRLLSGSFVGGLLGRSFVGGLLGRSFVGGLLSGSFTDRFLDDECISCRYFRCCGFHYSSGNLSRRSLSGQRRCRYHSRDHDETHQHAHQSAKSGLHFHRSFLLWDSLATLDFFIYEKV